MANATGEACAELSAVADAVLYEGYLLYPYRRSSAKNRVRWQFGVLLPRNWVERDGPVTPGLSGSADSWYQQTECLLRVRRADAAVRVRVRYLQLQHKQVEAADGDGTHRPVESLRTADGTAHLSFEEAVPRETELVLSLEELLRSGRTVAVGAPAGAEYEPLPAGAGRTVRRRREVRAGATVTAERLGPGLCRLRVRTENTGEAPDPRAPRSAVLGQALLATHTLLTGDGVEFVSLIDPPAALAEQVRGCRNAFTFPVLGGAPPEPASGDGATGALLLSAPIILPDHPQVAPESPGDLHDAAEIDEILTLRTMLLTDEEKAEARATDPRAARILDRVDTMPQEVFSRLHGAIRSLTPRTPAPERPPAPVVERPPAPVVERPLASATARPSATATERPPMPAPERPPAPVVERPPAPVVEQPPTPVVERPPAPATARPSATATERPPMPAAERPPTPAPAQPPTPAAERPPTNVVERPPTPATARPPATATERPPAPAPPQPPAPAPERPAWWQEGGDDGLSPATDTVLVDGVPVGGGSRVRLCPRGRGADAQDMFLAGRTARVAAVFHDVDGSTHLAVTVDDDPAAELHGWYGRFHYFRPDEVESLGPDAPPGPGRPIRPQSPRPPERPAGGPEEGRFDGRP
ncbi:hypothetical protein ADK77_20375 [Streptomyces antibioticus]|nr:hypothetical protein [Streptomyces antibioticus]KOG64852.1 hypothetical protein ADK77_20375 [Streptomyces antibioticus]